MKSLSFFRQVSASTAVLALMFAFSSCSKETIEPQAGVSGERKAASVGSTTQTTDPSVRQDDMSIIKIKKSHTPDPGQGGGDREMATNPGFDQTYPVAGTDRQTEETPVVSTATLHPKTKIANPDVRPRRQFRKEFQVANPR